jgi:1,4-alpha-glucan branching enzyme
MVFMGEETASCTPFLFFIDHAPALAQAVREGRRREFAHLPEFADPDARARIPDPNDPETFEASIPRPDPLRADSRRELYRRLIEIRMKQIVPNLAETRSIGAEPLGTKAILARWRLGQAGVLTLVINLGKSPIPISPQAGEVLFAIPDGADGRVSAGELPGYATIAFLDTAQ